MQRSNLIHAQLVLEMECQHRWEGTSKGQDEALADQLLEALGEQVTARSM